ncbi:MAG: type II toxin-antitoxin system RelE/ParE family toxin [Terriglobales bacterium]|jgi:plasmid stabilization system protein ParE
MAAKPIEIHSDALAELKSALRWYLERSESAADGFLAEIDRAIERIAATPTRWPSGDLGTRKFVLARFPYAVIYREKLMTIQILAVAHGHRRPRYWDERL